MTKLSERDRDNLVAILDYCDRIESIVGRFGNSFEIFNTDADYRVGIMMNVFQIGEASNRISDECREKLSQIPWQEIYGTRNIIAHGYIKVKKEIIWNIIENDIPLLKKEINEKAELKWTPINGH